MPYTKLRYPGTCRTCGQGVPAAAEAWWEPADRTVTCAACRPRTRQTNSARAFAQDRQARHTDRVRGTWGPLAGLVLFFRPDDHSTRVARKGAAGEERLTAYLDELAAKHPEQVVVLHDRGIPGRRENIDHLVVTSHGIWAVDAKAYAGTIRVPWLGRPRLVIGGRDQSRLLEQSLRQQQFITDALPKLELPALPVRGALCFLDADIDWSTNGRSAGGVLIATPRRLRRELLTPGPLTVEQVAWTAHRLAAWFPLSR